MALTDVDLTTINQWCKYCVCCTPTISLAEIVQFSCSDASKSFSHESEWSKTNTQSACVHDDNTLCESITNLTLDPAVQPKTRNVNLPKQLPPFIYLLTTKRPMQCEMIHLIVNYVIISQNTSPASIIIQFNCASNSA